MKKETVTNGRTIMKIRCIAGLVLCAIVIALTMYALILNISDFFNDDVPEAGLGTLRMYTTISNILASVAASICVPFQIDGLRKNRYKLPHWIVSVMYVGAMGLFVTFFCAITIISISQGFVLTMFEKSNIFMHTINPIVIILLFTADISDSRIKFWETAFAMTPLVVYAIVYFVMVFIAKEWRDHYGTNTYMPWPVSFVLILLVGFGSSQLLRILHNLTNKYVNGVIVKYYMKSPDYEFPRITDAIAHLAEQESSFYYKDDDIYIHVDIIKLLSDRYHADSLPLDIQYDIYLENYLKNIKVKE